jgi:hypothetical protein
MSAGVVAPDMHGAACNARFIPDEQYRVMARAVGGDLPLTAGCYVAKNPLVPDEQGLMISIYLPGLGILSAYMSELATCDFAEAFVVATVGADKLSDHIGQTIQ